MKKAREKPGFAGRWSASATKLWTPSRQVVVSDRAVSQANPVVALAGAVHHHLIKAHARTRIGLGGNGGLGKNHLCCFGYGADAINPYLAFEALWQARRDGLMDDAPHIQSDDDVVAAIAKKVMAKMGISTLQSIRAPNEAVARLRRGRSVLSGTTAV